MNEEKRKNKKSLKIVLIILGILLGIVLIIIAIPIIAFWPLIKEILFVRPGKPTITHGEFPFKLVYEYKGKKVTIEDTIICDYKGQSFSLEGGNSNDWTCDIQNDDEYGNYYIDKENYPDLYIKVPESPEYYMGDPEVSKEYSLPYIHYIDESTGTYYEETDKVEVVDVEIIEWDSSEPLKNTFK